MRSLDGGQTFEDRKPGGQLDAHALATHRLAPDRVYASGLRPGVAISAAAAATGLSGGRASPFVARLVSKLGLSGSGYAESPDGGATWLGASDGVEHHYLWSIVVDCGDPDNVVISAAHSPQQAHDHGLYNATVYYRRRGGQWRQPEHGFPSGRATGIPVLRVSPSEPWVNYAATNQGVLRSADAGQTWTWLPVDWPSRYRLQHVQGLAIIS